MDRFIGSDRADKIVRRVIGVSLVILLLVAAAATAMTHRNTVREWLSDEAMAAQATVYVALNDNGSHGSGVVIAPGVVLTNQHVVSKLDKVNVEFPNGDKREAKIAWKGLNGYDLAVLLVDTKGTLPAPIACGNLPVGTAIFAHGHPMSLRAITTWGRVASAPMTSDDEIMDATVLDLTITSGNSGGGIWSGRYLVGLATAVVVRQGFFGPGGQTGHSVMIPSSAICRVLGRS